jgi:hypothetical protein
LAIDNENEATGWKLKAFKYYYLPWKDIGLGGIVVEPTDVCLPPHGPTSCHCERGKLSQLFHN